MLSSLPGRAEPAAVLCVLTLRGNPLQCNTSPTGSPETQPIYVHSVDFST